MKTNISAGGIVVNSRGEILVVNQNHDSWSLPKGHVEAGEELIAAAKREIYEEAGLTDLQLVKRYPSYERYAIGKGGVGEDTTVLKTLHFFLFRTGQMDLQPRDPDNPEARWVAPEAVSGMLTHEKDREFFESVRSDIS